MADQKRIVPSDEADSALQADPEFVLPPDVPADPADVPDDEPAPIPDALQV